MKHPISHTILPSGRSVEDCLQCLEATDKRALAIKDSAKELLHDVHDDFCVHCGIGGDLLCCETCPITCHFSCSGLKTAPEGPWYCPGCVCCLCHKQMSTGEAVATPRVYRGDACFVGNTPPSSSYHDILESANQKKLFLSNRPRIRQLPKKVVEKPLCKEATDIEEPGAKRHCSPEKENKVHLNGHHVEQYSEIKSVCGARAHMSCLPELAQPVGGGVPWYFTLEEKLVEGIAHICCQGALKVGEYACGSEVFFQIIHAAAAAGKHNQFQGLAPFYTESQKISLCKILSGCLAVINDAYNEIWDSRTGINLIPMMLQGQYAPPYLDFSGMYVAPLFVNSTIVSVACFRLLGSGVAELPLLATRQEIRGCKAGTTLLLKIQEVLYQFGVQKLVTYAMYCPLYPYLPAVHPQGETLPPPSQGKLGFKLASRETVSAVISHGGIRIPGVPWVEKNIEIVDWPSQMKILKETHLKLNTGVSDIDSRLRCGILSLTRIENDYESEDSLDRKVTGGSEDVKIESLDAPIIGDAEQTDKPREDDSLNISQSAIASAETTIVSLTDRIVETLTQEASIQKRFLQP